jgi:hemolysin activation/secretion protein
LGRQRLKSLRCKSRDTAEALVRHLRIALLICAIGAATAQRAEAQEPRPVLDPSRLFNELDALLKQRERRDNSAVPIAAPSVAEPKPTGRGKPLFRLQKIVVEGATAISPEAVEGIYAPFLGKDVTSADLGNIALAVSELYRSQGFHLSRAIFPPQDIAGGTITLRVIEGRFFDVRVVGAHSAHANLLLQTVTQEEIARLDTLERSLLLINDTPGHRVADTRIEEVGTASGKFLLVVQLETWPVSIAFGLDNFGVPSAGRLLTYFSGALSPSFKAGDSLRVSGSTVPDSPRELAFGQIWYDMPLANDGTRLGLSGSYGEVRPSDERRFRGVVDRSEIVELLLSRPALRTRRSSLWFSAGLGMQNFSEDESDGPVYKDRLRTITLRGSYQTQDAYSGWHQLGFGWRQGIDVLDASDSGTLPSRGDASPVFSRFDFAYARVQKLNESWSYRLMAAGQWSASPLLASQEFNLGGRAFGLGYDSGFIAGDQGVGANLELRYDYLLNSPHLSGYQFFAFIDGGSVRDIRAGGNWTASIASAGGGVRVYFKQDAEAEFGIAFPVAKSEPLGVDYGPRVFFSLSKAFKTCLPGASFSKCG